LVSRNGSFISQKPAKPWFRKKEVLNGVSKTPKKDYGFDNTIVLKTKRFIASKHPEVLETQSSLQNYIIFPIL